MPITPSLRHCSNKYKLAREGEKDKEKDEDFEKVKVHIFFIFFFICSQVELKEMSFQLLLDPAIQHSGWGWEDHSTGQER